MPSDQTDTLTLAAEFPPASETEWRKLVGGVLKGAPFEKLVSKTYDGLPIASLYPRARNAPPIAGRIAGAPWRIVQRIDHPDAAQANAQALHDLENGANGLLLTIAGGKGARGFGLEPTEQAIATALDGVHLDAGIDIELDLAPQTRQAALHVIALIEKRGIDPALVHLRAGFDPIGAAACSGLAPQSWEAVAPVFGKVISGLAARGFRSPLAAADGRVIHDAGGTEAQELAFVLATGVAYLRALEASGMALDSSRDAIFARLSADADQFLTMAKFRALRRLWARVERSCGLEPKPLHVSAETAWRTLTQRDSAVNMLRATMATFAAGVAGADAISVLPHTLALGLPDPFARRVARNTHLILLEESNIAKVGDPAAGSGAIETLTTQLCEQAWKLFQEIERAGGIMAALAQGMIQRHVALARDARAKNIARRRDVLTGASEFPNLQEAVPAVLASPSPLGGEGRREASGWGASSQNPTHPRPQSASDFARGDPTEDGGRGEESAAMSFAPLVPIRLAQPFEALRDRSDAILAKTGVRSKVLLVTLGAPADYTPRLTFAKSFFEAGGIEAEEKVLEQVVAGVPLVCLCSSDKVYAREAEAAARALQKSGAKHIYLAGRPGDLEAALRDAGVSEFIVAGGDAVATLTAAYDKMVSA